MPKVFIGTSGFFYPHWKGEFYPPDLPQSRWFEYYCQHFKTVEINSTFYRLPKKETFTNWRKKAGKDFVFALKGNRYITHVKKLKDCREAVKRFLAAAEGLTIEGYSATNFSLMSARKDRKISPTFRRGTSAQIRSKLLPRTHTHTSAPLRLFEVILWQLPPRFKVNPERLGKFLKLLPNDWRQAFEFRDESWNDTRVFKLIRQYGAAIVIQDYPHWPIIQEVTADFVYLRFHGLPAGRQGKQALYSSCYTKKELKEWGKKIRTWMENGLDVYAYFNNDALGYAVENARELSKSL